MANEAVQTASRKPKRTKPKPKPADSEEEEPLAEEGGGKDQTRAKFNEVLQEAYLQSTKSDGKKKKKVRTDKSALKTSEHGPLLDKQLESLRKGDGIRKDTDNSLLLANTYDPDDDPKSNKKSNKRRQREMQKPQNGVENQAYTEENEISTRKPKKKTKKPLDENDDKPMTIHDLAPSPIKKSHKPSAEPEVGQKKKKKKKTTPAPDDHDEEQVLSEGPEAEADEDPSKDKGVTSDPEEGATKVKKKKKKKKTETTEPVTEDEGPPDIEDHGRIVSLIIHRTDKLKTDFLISHPLVRVTVVDEVTGKYLKKQHQTRAVTSYYENESVDFVLPMMSQPYDFKQNKSTLPVWEEMLIFNENFDYFIQNEPKVIVFFEILDFMSMNAANQKRQAPGRDGGWHKIAWAFYKVIGGNGKPNTDRKVRLQLYQPPVQFRTKGDQLEVYQWWKGSRRVPYPSTLYITLKGIIPPETVEPAARSMYATQEERGRMTYDEMQRTLDGGTSKRDGRTRGPSLWTRLAGQLCKVPNNLFMGLPAGKKGCFVVRFSHDGKYLACGCHDLDGYPILIYEIPSGKLRGQLNGHYSIIYDLCWSRDHSQLLSGSADGTARIWDVGKMSSTASKTLPHPSFVYTAKFHQRVDKIVVTGGYDRMIRVWTLRGEDNNAQLLQELDGHISFVNTLCFDAEGQTMYSGDSLGQIRVWAVFVTDKPSSNGFLREWTLQKEISEPEFKGVAINCLKLHPSGRRLLVHTRDNTLRLYDLRIGAIMQRYRGALNFREHLRSTFSPCGSFILMGSEDSCAYVWNSDTGDQVASYKELGFRRPVSDVDYHPQDHMVAFCSFGENHQVLVYKYDHRVAQRDVGLEPVDTLDATQKRGRAMAPSVKPGAELQSDEDVLETVRSLTGPRDISLQQSARMDRAKRKLDSVLGFQASTRRPASPDHPLGVPKDTAPYLTGTWGSTFDSTAIYSHGRAKSPEPSAFSPHASRTMSSAVANQQQLSAQTEYMRQGHGSWRPGFTDVGRRSGGPSTLTRTPVTLSTSQGKPQLQIHGSKSTQQWVVALYDYQKQRSDELAFSRGDVLRVICKDTDNWWLGQNSTGEEGYIPANYFTTQGAEEDNLLEYENVIKKEDDEESDDLKRSRTTAVIAKSGELKFISATEDSDAESTVRRKKKTRKPREQRDTILNMESDTDSTTKVHRRRRSKVNESPA